MTLLLETDRTLAAPLVQQLGLGTEVVVRTEDLDQRLRRRSEYAVVLGPGLDLADALTTAERIRLEHPTTAVILSRHEIRPELYAHALDAGVSAVVLSYDEDALTAAMSRARLTWEAITGPGHESRSAGRVVTVFSPKGGVGKTTMTVNIALALNALGSRVCVVDLDLAFGDVAITMQLIPTHTIADAAGLEDQLDWSMLESLVSEHRSGVTVLAAPTNPEGRERITPGLVRRVIGVLRERFDHVVIDTPPGFDDQVLGAFDETDDIVVVATLDVPTIKNVKVALETLDLLHLVRDHRHLVLNRADEEVGLTAGNVQDLLGIVVDLTLPSNIAVASATNHGDPIVAAQPDHEVSRAILDFCRVLPGVAPSAPAPHVARRSRFGRRRKEAVR
jgi:pilus assembly protein CpaE